MNARKVEQYRETLKSMLDHETDEDMLEAAYQVLVDERQKVRALRRELAEVKAEGDKLRELNRLYRALMGVTFDDEMQARYLEFVKEREGI